MRSTVFKVKYMWRKYIFWGLTIPPHLNIYSSSNKDHLFSYLIYSSHFRRMHDCIERMQQAVKPLGVPSRMSGVSWGFSADTTHKIHMQMLWTNAILWMQWKEWSSFLCQQGFILLHSSLVKSSTFNLGLVQKWTKLF